MTKDLKDILIHMLVAVIGTILLLMLMHPYIAIGILLVLICYAWELGQRVARDQTGQGVLYWWNPAKWGNQARLEFLVPANCAILILLIFLKFAL